MRHRRAKLTFFYVIPKPLTFIWYPNWPGVNFLSTITNWNFWKFSFFLSFWNFWKLLFSFLILGIFRFFFKFLSSTGIECCCQTALRNTLWRCFTWPGGKRLITCIYWMYYLMLFLHEVLPYFRKIDNEYEIFILYNWIKHLWTIVNHYNPKIPKFQVKLHNSA